MVFELEFKGQGVILKNKDIVRPARTAAEYIQAEFDLSKAMGLHPKKFKSDVLAENSSIMGTWIGRGGVALPAWARDNGAAFHIMALHELFPAGGIGEIVYIQWGIDLEDLAEPVARHESKEAAIRYAVTVAAAEYLQNRPKPL